MTDTNASNQDGLICAYALDGKGGGQSVGWSDIERSLDAGRVHWLHMDFTNQRVRTWLRESSGLDGTIVDALLDDESRPRVVEQEGNLLVILRGVNMNPDSDPEDMVSIRVFVQANRIITTRRRQLLTIKAIEESLSLGGGPKDSADFLLRLVEGLDERIGPVVENLDEKIELAESRFTAANIMTYAGEFSGLRRQTARIRRYLAPQRDALDRLSKQTTAILSAEQGFEIREEADRITRYLEDLDLVRERSMVAQEEILGQLASEQNRRIYILSLVAAIFLPLSFLTGLMGMNVAGLPGTENVWSFAVIVVLMTGTAVAIVAFFRWKKWL